MLARTRTTALAAAAALLLATCGDDGGGLGAGPASSDGDDAVEQTAIVLEPVDAVMPNPFMEGSLDVVGDLSSLVERAAPAVGAGLVDPPDVTGRLASGTGPGLYGGSRDEAVCDVDQLVAFLTDPANAEQAAAWAEVQGIAPDEVEEYVEGLTPVRLRLDTRVTNHGFEEGEAAPFQSVLQAGTAVLVDDEGVPRVKCFCGNPLAPPEPVPGEGDEGVDADELIGNVQDAWDGFDWGEVLQVEPGEPVEALQVYDLNRGDLFLRPVGTTGGDDRPAEPEDGSDEPDPEEQPPEDSPEPPSDPSSGGGGEAGDCPVPDTGAPVVSMERTGDRLVVTYADGTIVELAC